MIARAPFEAFDADQITPRCEECGLSEYSCECEVESWAPQLSEAEVAHRDLRIAEILKAKAEQEASLVEVEWLGDGRLVA